jgi:release factor glutamine methyltransferase
MNLREALATAFSRLYQDPTLRDEALEEATQLLLHAVSISRATLLTNYERSLTPEQEAAYTRMIDRRMLSEPVQYIIGEREFYGLPMRVGPAVLIPRSLTEHLVETVIEEFRARDQAGESLRIADVGTGSGAIAIAIAVHLPNAQLTALDLSAAALEVAAENARLNNVAARVRCIESNVLAAVAHEPPFDAIVSNPPYIPTTFRSELHSQVRDYEPGISLYGGESGLEIYRLLIPQARAALKPNGLFAAEIGPDQLDAITAMLADWDDLHFINNLKSIPRIAIARRP